MSQRPQFEAKISLGNVLTAITIVAAAGLLWGQMDARLTEVEDDVDRHENVMVAHAERLRIVEMANGRTTATLDLILEQLRNLNDSIRDLRRQQSGERQ